MSELFHVPSMIQHTNPDGRVTVPWTRLYTNMTKLLNSGYPPPTLVVQGQLVPKSITIPIAKITGGGANGSLTFTNGILTAAVAPT
jgi:hypothetical protein